MSDYISIEEKLREKGITSYFIRDTGGKTYIKVTFELSGDNVNLDNINEEMKLSPTFTRKKEEFHELSGEQGAAKDIWVFSTCYNEGLLVADEIEKILVCLSGKTGIINKLKKTYNLKSMLTVSIQANEKPYPLIPLSCIEFAYKTNTEIEFDPYYY
ncbi:MAG: DUF4279 domain-containing protein [Eubacteriales bacterium]|jgi:hypothetical protein